MFDLLTILLIAVITLMTLLVCTLTKSMLLKALRDTIIVSGSAGIYLVVAAYLLPKKVEINLGWIWIDMVDFYRLYKFPVLFVVASYVVVAAFRWCCNQLRVSKPGSLCQSKSSTCTRDERRVDSKPTTQSDTPNVMILNTLASLSHALSSVFARQEKVDSPPFDAFRGREVPKEQSSLSGLYQELREIKELLAEISHEKLYAPHDGLQSNVVSFSPPTTVSVVKEKKKEHRKGLRGREQRLVQFSSQKHNGAENNRRASSEEVIDLKLPNAQSCVTPFDPSKYENMSEMEVLQKLRKEEWERRKSGKLPEFLNEVERSLAIRDLSRLAREWKRRAGFPLKDADYRNLGTLSRIQAELPRRLVLQILKRRRIDASLQQAREEGREIRQCEVCEAMIVKDTYHQCFLVPWGDEKTRNGVPHKKQIVVSQSGRGALKIGQQFVVDNEKLEKEREKLSQFRLAYPVDRNGPRSESPNANNAEGGRAPITETQRVIEREEAVDSPLMRPEVTANVVQVSPKVLYDTMMRVVEDSHLRHFLRGSLSEYPD